MANMVSGADMNEVVPCVTLKGILRYFPKKFPELAAIGRLDTIHKSDRYNAADYFAGWTIVRYWRQFVKKKIMERKTLEMQENANGAE